MKTNEKIASSFKKKLYQETLDEFARRQWNPGTKNNDFKNWKELIKVYPAENRGWHIYLEDIEKAVKLAIDTADTKARADERQKCIEELNGIDGKTEDEMVMFMGHILERIRKREEGRAKLSGGSKELPPRELIWEGITYYKEQAIAKFSERVD